MWAVLQIGNMRNVPVENKQKFVMKFVALVEKYCLCKPGILNNQSTLQGKLLYFTLK